MGKDEREDPMARIPNAETTLVDLFALAKVPGKEGTFMSLTPAWASGGAWSAFGGHVFAQSIWAAVQEVPDEQVVHSCHGYFTLPGMIDRPYVFVVQHINDTRGTSQRAISVYQPLTPSERASPMAQFDIADAEKPMSKIRFHMICSFKRPMAAISQHQLPTRIPETYKAVMDRQKPEEAMDAPDVDTPWYHQVIKRYPEVRTFPGLDIRKADCRHPNEGKPAEQWRQLNYYRLKGTIPKDGEWTESRRRNLAAVGHAFASDRNSLFLISHAMGFGDELAKIASLGHSIVFHTDGPSLLMEDAPGRPTGSQKNPDWQDRRGWWVQEAWTSRSGEGRGIHESRLWAPGGMHVATTMQDGLVRKAEGETPPMFEGVLEILDERAPVGAKKLGRKKPVGEEWENSKL